MSKIGVVLYSYWSLKDTRNSTNR